MAFEHEVKPAELITEDKRRYAAPGGVGPNKSIVAFSAIRAQQADVPDDGRSASSAVRKRRPTASRRR